MSQFKFTCPQCRHEVTADGRKVGYLDRYLSADMACNIEKGMSYAAEFVKLVG